MTDIFYFPGTSFTPRGSNRQPHGVFFRLFSDRQPNLLLILVRPHVAVAVGTANFANPRATLDVIEGIEAYMERYGIGDVNEIREMMKDNEKCKMKNEK